MHKKRTRAKGTRRSRAEIQNQHERTQADPIIDQQVLPKFEQDLITLVHFLAFGNKMEFGLTLEETLLFMTKPIPHKYGMTAIEALKKEGPDFIQELRSYLESRS